MIAAIENAMLARLRAASEATVDGAPLLGYRYRFLETYPADWDALLKEKRQINPPGIWVGFAGGQFARDEHGQVIMAATFGLTVISKHHGSEESRRHGAMAQGEPGSYLMMTQAIQLLHYNSLGLDIQMLELGQVRHVRPGDALREIKASMLAASFKTSFPIELLPDDLASEDPGIFETFHANWDIPPFGGIDADTGEDGIQLPDDPHADATDHVELEQ